MRHYLKHNARSGMPGVHIVIDTETHPHAMAGGAGRFVHRLRLGWLMVMRLREGRMRRAEPLLFLDANAAWSTVLAAMHPRRSVWLWAHNLGFDLRSLRVHEVFESGDLTIDAGDAPASIGGKDRPRRQPTLMVTDDPPTIIVARDQRGAKLVMVDTMNFFPCALAKLARMVGMEKGDLPGEVADDEDWSEYCLNDVMILAAVVERWLAMVRSSDLGNLRYTIAGQSLALFRHRCQTDRCLIDQDPVHKELERASYYGGAVRCRYLGWSVAPGIVGVERFAGVNTPDRVADIGPVYACDVNSCYPYVMGTERYPVEYLRCGQEIEPNKLARLMVCYEACGEVIVDTLARTYPYRMPDRVSWSRGRFATFLCGAELRAALQAGDVARVLRYQLYRSGRPFERFAAIVLDGRAGARERGDALEESAWKMLGNALHGKFGQRAGGWEIQHGRLAPCQWGAYHVYDHDERRWRTCRAINGTPQIATEGGEHPESFPVIAAYVSSAARELLRRYRQIVGPTGWVYEDADSLHLTRQGYALAEEAGLIHPTRPGALKVTGVVDVARYCGAKHYYHDGVMVRAGRSQRGHYDEQGCWHQDTFEGYEASLNHWPVDGPICWDQIKRDEPHLIDGVVNEGGWVDPIIRVGG